MTDSSHKMPNYVAFFVLLLGFAPLIAMEFMPLSEVTNHSFFVALRNNFGFFLFFLSILYIFTFSQSIIQYDQIPKKHHFALVSLLAIFGFALISLSIAWMGYFNAGPAAFIWLNPS